MIESLNAKLEEQYLDVFIGEVESREEMVCVLNACAIALSLCGGQACAIACIGISACAVGAHAW